MPNTTPHATPPLTISRAVAGTLFLILSVALVAAAADLFAAVSEHGRKLAGARAAGGMTVTGTLALAFALLVVLVSALLPAKIARAALSARAVGGAIAAATMAVVIIYPGVPPHRLTEQPTILIAAFFAGVAAFAAGSRLGSDSWRSGWRGMVRALVAAFPIAAIGAAAVMFDVKVTRSQPGAIAGIAAFATVFAALTAFFLRRFGPRVALVPVAVIAILTGLGGARELHRGRASLVIPAPKNAPPKGVRHV
ncbi:hypothetical protein K8I61_07430, partial [bacterium]|nr:hypothetical protein [bacterium]